MTMEPSKRIRQAVEQKRYRISSHAIDEMADDLLILEDVKRVLLTGTIAHKYTHDPRGVRFVVTGKATDNRQTYVVCRFLMSGVLLVITAYVE